MIYQEGYVYHIKDEYFKKVQDDKLRQNKENGTYRPTFYCLRDSKTSLLWMVPLSSQVEKYEATHNKQVAQYGKIRQLLARGKKIVFPDIARLEQIMLKELQKDG